MKTLSLFLIFVLLILSSRSEIDFFSYNNCTCKQHERKALLNFKDSLSFVTIAPGYHPLSSWVGEDCCNNWVGVSCDDLTCNVVTLDTFFLGHLRSKVVSPALFKLKHLRYLSLVGIDFSGSRIPKSIGSFKHLQYLQLSECNFNGPIPQQFNNLTNLQHLDILYSFQGNARVDNLRWISGLQKIKELDLSGMDLSQTPNNSFRVFHQFLSLQSLRFKDCKLSSIHFSQFFSNSTFLLLSFISNLDFSNNNLVGPIPYTLANLSNLSQLDLSNNSLSGVIHADVFANLSELNVLRIGSNSLVLESSHDIAGNPSFPKWLLSKKFIDLDLSYCGISLPLPQINKTWPILSYLNLANNNIYGNLSHLFGNIVSLILANNYISGSLPKSLCNSPQLSIIELQNNKLSRKIPNCLDNITKLSTMDLSSNKISGFIPSSLWKISQLELLNLRNNTLEGELPILNTSLSLIILDLSENMLSGFIPRWNEEQFSDLQILRLRSNHLVGLIPLQLCSLNKSLHILDLADNYLTGVIPQCFDHFDGMKIYSSKFSSLPSTSTIEEIIKGVILRYTINLNVMVNLDLSSNNMVGPIPPNLTSLKGLKNLNLSYNHLTGAIPSNIGKLRSLESLDLSNNCLSGSIPQSMSDLNYLEILKLSNNNLSGPIPTGNQLQTLNDPANYMGNPSLCADFLPQKCTIKNYEKNPNQDREKEHEDDAKHEEMWLYVFILLGIAIGFWGVIVILIVKR